ncbi:MAG: hypothetical protein QW140_02970 [Candidatus Aenigmatarchaeota archaeon]
MRNIEKLVGKVTKLVVEFLGEDLICLYWVGSSLYGSMKKRSDIDVFGIVKEDFDFIKEDKVNNYLKKNFEKKYKIEARFRGITISELEGGEQKGRLTKWIPISILIKSLSRGKVLYGKYDWKKCKVKPVPLKQEGWHYIGLIEYFIPLYRKNYREAESQFKFKDFIKLAYWLANVELQLEGYEYTPNFKEIEKRVKRNHIVHLIASMREKDKITKWDKEKILNKLEEYVEEMKRKL